MAYGIWENGKLIAKFAAPLTLRSNVPMFVSDTLSLRRFTYQRAVQRWELDAKLAPQSTTANDLMVNLITKGYSEIFTITTPQNVGAKTNLTATADIYTAANAEVFSTQVTIAAAPDQSGRVIPKGTFINFGNIGKVFMLTSDLILSSTNTSTANIHPQLRTAISANTQVKYQDDVLMHVRYDTDVVRGMVYEDGILMDNGVVKFIEAV